MAGASDDELARTATAAPSGEEAAPLGATLGRYKLERAIAHDDVPGLVGGETLPRRPHGGGNGIRVGHP